MKAKRSGVENLHWGVIQ